MRMNLLLPLASALFMSACVNLPSPDERRQQATTLAHEQGWQSLEVETALFRLQAYVPGSMHASDELTLYFEGDGLAWINARSPSTDPTPVDPLALHLALEQPQGNAAYLGRPCQYLDASKAPCARRYWTEARFAEAVVNSLDQAADHLKIRAGARRLILVGYSGGGALAMLVAARRSDVVRVITVAGNLDHTAWTLHHRVALLRDSLNPAWLRPQLANLEQYHLTGERDRVMPPRLAEDFIAGYPPGHQARVMVLPGYDHSCCWAEHWKTLWPLVRYD